jgi:hypothetical protein
MLLDASADGEDVRIDDDVLGREAGLAGEQLDRPMGDGDAALDGLGLPSFVEGHDHDRGTVAARQACLAQELDLALLEGDRVDDGAALGRP